MEHSLGSVTYPIQMASATPYSLKARSLGELPLWEHTFQGQVREWGASISWVQLGGQPEVTSSPWPLPAIWDQLSVSSTLMELLLDAKPDLAAPHEWQLQALRQLLCPCWEISSTWTSGAPLSSCKMNRCYTSAPQDSALGSLWRLSSFEVPALKCGLQSWTQYPCCCLTNPKYGGSGSSLVPTLHCFPCNVQVTRCQTGRGLRHVLRNQLIFTWLPPAFPKRRLATHSYKI